MSATVDAIQSYAAQVEANFTLLNGALTGLKADIAAQNQQIAAFQAAQLAAGTLSTADAAALQQIVTDSATLVTTATGILPAPPAAPVAASPAPAPAAG